MIEEYKRPHKTHLWLQCKLQNILSITKWPPRKFGHFTASGRSENTFSHILHDLGYILHSPKPLLFVLYEPFLGAVEEFSAFTFSDFKKNTFTSKIMADFAATFMFVNA